jgi:hypothetical protein
MGRVNGILIGLDMKKRLVNRGGGLHDRWKLTYSKELSDCKGDGFCAHSWLGFK